jgi:hypothetical protein
MKRLLPALALLAALCYPAAAGVMETDGSPSPSPSPTPQTQSAPEDVDPLRDLLVDLAPELAPLVPALLSLL